MRYLTILAAPVFALLLAGCGEGEPEPEKPGARKDNREWSDHAPIDPQRPLKALRKAKKDLKGVGENRGLPGEEKEDG